MTLTLKRANTKSVDVGEESGSCLNSFLIAADVLPVLANTDNPDLEDAPNRVDNVWTVRNLRKPLETFGGIDCLNKANVGWWAQLDSNQRHADYESSEVSVCLVWASAAWSISVGYFKPFPWVGFGCQHLPVSLGSAHAVR